MAEFSAIRAVTRSMRELLRTRITNAPDPELNGIVIDTQSPRELRDDANAPSPVVSMWLYRVERNGYTLNAPPPRLDPRLAERRPLPINLYYLITPLAQNPEDEQLLLGRVLQAFNDVSTLRGTLLQGSLAGELLEFRISLDSLRLDELTRVWDALREPYQLSVSYLVQVTDISSGLQPQQAPVVESVETEYAQIESSN